MALFYIFTLVYQQPLSANVIQMWNVASIYYEQKEAAESILEHA